MQERDAKEFLPNLKLVNGIGMEVTALSERNKIRNALDVMKKLSLIANVYVVGQGPASQAFWYVNDEIGSIISHSDAPNVRMRSFIHSPSNTLNDVNRLEVSVIWPITEIKDKHGFLKDNL